ncbi:transcription factor HES-1-B-like [Stylophora pistillata]|uniref:Transcription factor HES-1-B n=1 Tax=Stylophora pistillata TaxID=50429 RepID=A0A2B4SJ91_STYPI|nr:transcription factor HES-1-B-like [Stylophora pistillata]XP_022783511.1 transcription factor HES-1-B-like [Stylophora pistillata]XP_022783512.1 transcription factor HES-1-B-like [Stylophora pistillata]PFX29951.1 Transcription factor HES-1-B [Stylophora pistillata]
MAVECYDSAIYVSKILSERRKAKKPLMEKMRRARINESLNEMKSLVLDLLHKDASRYSKMEKADVLEMTVTYLKALQRKDCRSEGPQSPAEYRAGFNQCFNEVNRSTTCEGNEQLREKLLSHLASCYHSDATNRVATSHASGIPAVTSSFPAIAPNTVWVPYPSPPPSPTNQPTVFIPVTSPVKTEMLRIPSPVSPSAAQTQQISLSPASSLSAETKTPLWRPW